MLLTSLFSYKNKLFSGVVRNSFLNIIARKIKYRKVYPPKFVMHYARNKCVENIFQMQAVFFNGEHYILHTVDR